MISLNAIQRRATKKVINTLLRRRTFMHKHDQTWERFNGPDSHTHAHTTTRVQKCLVGRGDSEFSLILDEQNTQRYDQSEKAIFYKVKARRAHKYSHTLTVVWV